MLINIFSIFTFESVEQKFATKTTLNTVLIGNILVFSDAIIPHRKSSPWRYSSALFPFKIQLSLSSVGHICSWFTFEVICVMRLVLTAVHFDFSRWACVFLADYYRLSFAISIFVFLLRNLVVDCRVPVNLNICDFDCCHDLKRKT